MMKTDLIKWKSPTLGEQREVMVVGEQGTPVLVFPSVQGGVEEWLNHGMFDSLREQVDEGYNQFFCLSGLMDRPLEVPLDRPSSEQSNVQPNKQSNEHPKEQPHKQSVSDTDAIRQMVKYQNRYLDYVHDEVFPYVQRTNGNEYWIVAGVGEGAYLAAMAAWKFPERIKKVILINGIFQYGDVAGPVSYIETMNLPVDSNPFDQLDVRILTYENATVRQQSHWLSDALWARSCEHQFYVWNLHAESSWELAGRMMREHIF